VHDAAAATGAVVKDLMSVMLRLSTASDTAFLMCFL
jgi:hypothetical protein